MGLALSASFVKTAESLSTPTRTQCGSSMHIVEARTQAPAPDVSSLGSLQKIAISLNSKTVCFIFWQTVRSLQEITRKTQPDLELETWKTLILKDGNIRSYLELQQIQTVIKPRFYPRLCQFLMKIIPVIKLSVRMR